MLQYQSLNFMKSHVVSSLTGSHRILKNNAKYYYFFVVFIEIFMISRSIYLPAPKGVKYVLSGGVKLPFLSRNLSGLNTSGSGNTTGSRHPDRRLAVTLTPVKTKQSFI